MFFPAKLRPGYMQSWRQHGAAESGVPQDKASVWQARPHNLEEAQPGHSYWARLSGSNSTGTEVSTVIGSSWTSWPLCALRCPSGHMSRQW